MVDSKELLRRAAELKDQLAREKDRDIRERLLRMAQYYEHLAEHEAWLAATSDLDRLDLGSVRS
jgi:hypothetical protein